MNHRGHGGHGEERRGAAVQLIFTKTPQDLIDYNNNHLASTQDGRLQRRNFILIPALVAFCFAILWLSPSGPGLSILLLTLPIGWLCVAAFAWKIYVKQQLERAIALGHSNGFFSEHTFTIGPEGFVSSGADIKIEMKWRLVKEVVAADNGIYVYTAKRYAYIVPNSAFGTDVQREQFLEQMMQYREQAAGTIEAAQAHTG